jgi:splicing factor 45
MDRFSTRNWPSQTVSTSLTMAPESTPSKPGGMMSLYANLLDPSAESTPGTISRAPVVFKQSSETDTQSDESAAKKQQLNAGTFEFL